jgi:hypothetical protein
MENRICRYCKEPFAQKPGKNRCIDEGPSCKPDPAEGLPVSATRTPSRPMARPWYEQPKIKRQIKSYLLLMKPFKGTSRREAFSSWEKAYKDGKPWAEKILNDVVEIQKAVSAL